MTDNKGPDDYRQLKPLPEHKFILKHRKPIPEPNIMKWGKYMQRTRRRVRRTFLPNNIWVSTVFLGLDHSFSPKQYPLTFETMINVNGEFLDYQTRCSTWRQALRMHWKAVEYIK